MYIAFQLIDLCMPQRTVIQSMKRILGFRFANLRRLKQQAAKSFEESRQIILQRMVSGPLIHADETQIGIKGKPTYVWVLTSQVEVVYLHSETREGDMIQEALAGFKGVLVSDFYAPYDSIDCAQQKCLLHLMRDLNDALLDHPYDEEVKTLVKSFAELLRPMVETVDRYGLKKRFLGKHVALADRFFRQLAKSSFKGESALKCQQRLEKNRDKLFTFLKYDGVSWNNNNAEHAIKAFARLRRVIEGLSTLKGIDEYLILLSVCQTCRYQDLDFLDFLRSGEKDTAVFAASARKRRVRVAED